MPNLIKDFLEKNSSFKFHLNEFSESFKFDLISRNRLNEFFEHIESSTDNAHDLVVCGIRHLIPNIQAYKTYIDLEFSQYPCISKINILDENSSYLNKIYSVEQLWLRPTSGTTGRPTDIWYSPEFFFEQQLYGIIEVLAMRGVLKEEYLSLNIFAVILNDSKKIEDRFWCVPNDSFGLMVRPKYDESEYASYKNLVNNLLVWQPKILSLKPSTLESFIYHYSDNDDVYFQSVDYIISGGALLTKKTREAIETLLDVSIIDQYGLSEFGPLAVECSSGYYHSISNKNLFEIKHESNNTISNFGEGELVVTSIANQAMPLIRYLTGDLVKLHPPEFSCKCGLKTQVISNIEGRRLHHFIDINEKLLSTRFFDFIFENFKTVSDIHVTQSSIGHLDIVIISSDNNIDILDDLSKKIIALNYNFHINLAIQQQPANLHKFRFIGDLHL